MSEAALSRRPGQRRRRRLRIVIPAFPAVNIYSGVARRMTALGPVCVATSVNEVEGWDAEVIDENNYRRGAPRDASGKPDHEALQQTRPADAVGFYGGLTSTVPRLYELAKTYKRLGIKTIAGGQHFIGDNIAEGLRNDVDFVVSGEGEKVIKDLLSCLDGRKSRSEVRGIAYLEDGRVIRTADAEPLTDFDELPIPDFSVVRFAHINIYPVGRVRGCGMDCEFCTVKGRPRYASPDRLVEQIAKLYETFGARKFFLVDDLFGQDRSQTLRLCTMLAEYQRRVRKRFQITVQIRLDKAKDAEMLSAMREAGVFMVAIGYESPIAEELQAMNKRLKPQEMIALTRCFRRAGFRVHGMFIFGYPMKEGIEFRMSAKERAGRFRTFIRKARVDTVQVMLPVPLPGTELRLRLDRQHRLYPQEHIGWQYYDGNFPLFEPDEPLTAEEIQTSVHHIMGRFYRLKHMLSIGLHIMAFPTVLFYSHNIRAGWRLWSRRWWNSIFRFGGWLTLRKWLADFKKGDFAKRLARAKEALSTGHGRAEKGGPGIPT
jgi:radical SAM superfamily enzyme YgiQ (UPF0313 family)